MPIVTIEKDDELQMRSTFDLQIRYDITFKESIKNNIIEYNLAYNLINYIIENTNSSYIQAEENFDVFNHLKGYEGYAEKFVGIRSSIEADKLKQVIYKEHENSLLVDSIGSENLIVGLTTAIIDPWCLTLVYILITVLKFERWKIFIFAIAFALINETLLTLIKYTKTWGDSLGNQLLFYMLFSTIIYNSARVIKKVREKISAQPNI